MKSVFFALSFLFLSSVIFSQRQPSLVLNPGESNIRLKNYSSSAYFVEFTMTPLDNTRWDENRLFTTNYGSQSQDLSNFNGKTYLDFDICSSDNGSGMIVGLGYYRLATGDGSYYIDLDWRTSALAQNQTSYGSPDLLLEYDVQNHCFTEVGSSTSINGSSLGVWDWSGYPDDKDNLQPFPPNNLTVDNQTENYPIINWSHNTSANINRSGYAIYRCVTQYFDDTPNSFVQIGSTSANDTTYSDQNIEFGGWHYAHYRVKTINGDRESDYSNDACAALISQLNKKISSAGKDYNNGLLQNYPNPFNPITKIYYTVKDKGMVNLQVFDILGNKLADLVNEIKPAGEFIASFDGSYLPSGMYLCKIQSGSYIRTIKMLLMK